MICKICGTNETDNPDGICDDCTKIKIRYLRFDNAINAETKSS